MLEIIFFVILFFYNGDGLMRIDPLVETKVGLIRGMRSNNGDYSMFMGIPYATVNEANLFGDAIPNPVFEDTYNAVDDSAICPQLYQFNNTILGSLDCLHLNIYVPSSATSKNRLPVMVWLYGGYFRSGFGGRFLYGPRFIVRHNVILVTISYRIGPYGFMCLNIPEISGNQGLKDQLIALRWINNNIESFGGNVNQISLFGESAGGHSVDLHLLSPKEKLYNKVILQSGSALARTVFVKPDKNAPLNLASCLGYETTEINEALSFLSKVNSNLIIAATIELDMEFKPCIESEFEETDSFITENWVTAKVPKVANMPVLIGFNENEMMASHGNQNAEYFENLNIFSTYLTQIFKFDQEHFNIMHEIVRHFYLGDELLSENLKQEIINFDSDYTYNHPIQRTIGKYLESNASSIFYYMFAYNGERNLMKNLQNITAKGVAHADELGYLFDMELLSEEPSQEDQLVIDRMTTMWTNFAKLGDPTPQTSELLPVKWSPITRSSLNYLKIDKEMTMESRPYKDRMAFWDLFYKLNEKYHIDLK